MKSPFPGMDPYLETRWPDVHSRLNIYASDTLSQSLPPGLLTRCEERAIVSIDEDDFRDVIPDVSVFERGLAEPSTPSGANVSVAESVCLVLESQTEFKQRYLEIRDAASGGRVVTVIEFVSPTNKRPGDGLQKYLLKQHECRDGDVNLVEIDLTRQGDRSLIMPVARLPQHQRATYMATVSRAGDRRRIWVYRLPLQERLGGVPIPLRESDTDIVLDLQALIDQVYENGRYDQDLTYAEPLKPPLSSEDSQWAERLLKNRKTAS